MQLVDVSFGNGELTREDLTTSLNRTSQSEPGVARLIPCTMRQTPSSQVSAGEAFVDRLVAKDPPADPRAAFVAAEGRV